MLKTFSSRLLVTFAVMAIAASTCLAAEIDVTVSTDKTVYDFLEPISVSITATNPNDYAVTLEWPSSGQAAYIMDDTYDIRAYWVTLFSFSSLDIAAHDSYTWTYPHWFQYYTPGIGEHYVTGIVIYDGEESSPFSFEVTPEPASLSLLAFGGALLLRRKRGA